MDALSDAELAPVEWEIVTILWVCWIPLGPAAGDCVPLLSVPTAQIKWRINIIFNGIVKYILVSSTLKFLQGI